VSGEVLWTQPDGEPARETGQKFPAGAKVETGNCDGLCRRRQLEVAPTRLGPNFRLALEYRYCAECLADYILGAPVMGGHVYVLADDGLFHEVMAGEMVGEP
jgi:hypothetical protein